VEFVEFARSQGLLLDAVYPEDRVRRAPTVEHPKKRNATYKYTGDWGWVLRWDLGGDVVFWNDPNAKERTQEDIDRWRQHMRDNERKEAEKHDKASQLSKQLIRESVSCGHPYLHIKGFPEQIGFVHGHHLLIPMRDLITSKLSGLQQIWWDEPERKYNKKMLYGTRAKGAVLLIGDAEANEVCLCEGYATGLSIHKACRSVGLKTAVMVAFSAGNLAHVAPLIKGKKLWVFADNDRSETGQRTAVETGLPWTMSPHEGFDANDHHLKHGLMSLVGLIMKARAQC
jgi:putative DNA primase/helicase